jgi:hypothetical protein
VTRVERPAWGWRVLAWTVLIFVVLMPLPRVLAEGPTATVAINWTAVVGAFCYAYAREPRFLLFWRVFALPFSFYTAATLGIAVAQVVDHAGPRPAAVWLILGAILAVCFSVCIALLRHAQFLRGRQRSAARDLAGVFA